MVVVLLLLLLFFRRDTREDTAAGPLASQPPLRAIRPLVLKNSLFLQVCVKHNNLGQDPARRSAKVLPRYRNCSVQHRQTRLLV